MKTTCDFLPLTDRDFRKLRRTPAGDIIELVAIYPLLTEEQMLELTPDDAARVEEFDYADASLFADDLVEMGVCARIFAKIDDELWAEAA